MMLDIKTQKNEAVNMINNNELKSKTWFKQFLGVENQRAIAKLTEVIILEIDLMI
jgi:hypothetical protein